MTLTLESGSLCCTCSLSVSNNNRNVPYSTQTTLGLWLTSLCILGRYEDLGAKAKRHSVNLKYSQLGAVCPLMSPSRNCQLCGGGHGGEGPAWRPLFIARKSSLLFRRAEVCTFMSDTLKKSQALQRRSRRREASCIVNLVYQDYNIPVLSETFGPRVSSFS